jgi:NhaA family Na+:H+ antiporter
LLTPPTAWFGIRKFVEHAHASVGALRDHANDEDAAHPHLANLDRARREAVSPVERLEHALHRSVAFGIMPLFALANAGVAFDSVSFAGDATSVFLGVALGLIIGKPLGIFLLSWIAVRLGIASLPRNVTWAGVGVVGLVGGIGFTMALFIAQLAFPRGVLLDAAKLGVVAASIAAAVLGLAAGRRFAGDAGAHDRS